MFRGKYYTTNETLVAVHKNPAATSGNVAERYIGHDVVWNEGKVGKGELTLCWNTNGECTWVQGVVDNTRKYDLQQAALGDRFGVLAGKPVECERCQDGE